MPAKFVAHDIVEDRRFKSRSDTTVYSRQQVSQAQQLVQTKRQQRNWSPSWQVAAVACELALLWENF